MNRIMKCRLPLQKLLLFIQTKVPCFEQRKLLIWKMQQTNAQKKQTPPLVFSVHVSWSWKIPSQSRPNVTESKWIIHAGDGDPQAHSLNDLCVILELHSEICVHGKAHSSNLERHTWKKKLSMFLYPTISACLVLKHNLFLVYIEILDFISNPMWNSGLQHPLSFFQTTLLCRIL